MFLRSRVDGDILLNEGCVDRISFETDFKIPAYVWTRPHSLVGLTKQYEYMAGVLRCEFKLEAPTSVTSPHTLQVSSPMVCANVSLSLSLACNV